MGNVPLCVYVLDGNDMAMGDDGWQGETENVRKKIGAYGK